MKIGVLTDVHGNLHALEAALRLLKENGVDEIIHTGDVVDIGARSRECLERMLDEKVTMLLGNHDVGYVQGLDQHLAMSHVSAEHKKYVFRSLGEGYKRVVASFPTAVCRKCGKFTFAFQHYAFAPSADRDGYLFRTIENRPTAERFDEMFADIDADAVFFGHKHEPCDLIGKKTYVDVGSVGCHREASAKVVVVESDGESWRYRRLSAPYDREAMKRDMLTSGLPDAQALFDFYFDHIEPKAG